MNEHDVARIVADAVRNATAEQAQMDRRALGDAFNAAEQRLAAQVKQAADQSAAATLARAAEAIEETARTSVTEAGKRLTQGISTLTEQALASIAAAADEQAKRLGQAAEQTSRLIETLAAEREQAATEHAQRIAELRAVADQAEKDKAEAVAEREKAEKALSLLALAGDVETEAFAELAALEAEDKQRALHLKAERARIENARAVRAENVRRGLMAYYPELANNLAELSGETAEQNPAESTDAADNTEHETL